MRRRLLLNQIYGTYRPAAAVFDGSTYLTRGADLTGTSDVKPGTISAWVKPTAGDGSAAFFLRSMGGFLALSRTTGNQIDMRSLTSAAATVIQTIGTQTVKAGSPWTHFVASWDPATTTFHIYVNGHPAITTKTVNDATNDYTRTNWSVGATDTGTSAFTGMMSELYFAEEYLNISDPLNLAKFRTTGGYAVDLGATGTGPTGNVPIIYLRGSDFTTNAGSGGNFSVAAGTLTSTPNGPWQRN